MSFGAGLSLAGLIRGSHAQPSNSPVHEMNIQVKPPGVPDVKNSSMRAFFLGTPVDLLTMRQTVNMATGAMRSRTKITHVALNVAKLISMTTDPVLRADVVASDIIGADGVGLLWGAKLLGVRIPERVAGIDLMWNVLGECERNGFRPFFLGATRHVVASAAIAAVAAYPKLKMAGIHDGYFAHEKTPDIVAKINHSRADCLFVGLPTPRKEHFLAEYRRQLNVPFVMGVGGSFDVIGGKVSRAPRWMQASGLEWLFRTVQEPRRLAWRYANTNSRFLLLVVRELLNSRVNASPREKTR